MKKEIKKGVILNYLNIIIGGLLVFLLEPFIIKKLGQSTYGVYTLINSFTNCLTLFEFGLGTTIIHYVSKFNIEKKEDQKKELFSMMLVIYFLIIIVITISSIILYNLIDNIFNYSLTINQIKIAKKIFIITAINVNVTVLNSLFSSILNGYEKFFINRIIILISTILNCILTIIVLIINPKALMLSLVSLITSIMILLGNIFYVAAKLKVKIKLNTEWNKDLFKEIFKFSIFVFLQTLISQIYWRIDQIIIGTTIPNSAVTLAIYAVAIKLNDLVLTFTTVLNRYQLPQITKIILKDRNNKKLTKYIIKISRIISVIYIAIILGFCFLGKNFIILYGGKDYFLAYPIVLIFIISASINRIFGIINDIFKVKKINGIYTLITLFTACLNIILTFILIPKFGIIGAAIGTAISIIIGHTICPFILLNRKIGINILDIFKKTFKGYGRVILISTIFLLIMNRLLNDSILEYLFKCVCFCIIYLILVYRYTLVKKEKETIIKRIGEIYNGILFKK